MFPTIQLIRGFFPRRAPSATLRCHRAPARLRGLLGILTALQLALWPTTRPLLAAGPLGAATPQSTLAVTLTQAVGTQSVGERRRTAAPSPAEPNRVATTAEPTKLEAQPAAAAVAAPLAGVALTRLEAGLSETGGPGSRGPAEEQPEQTLVQAVPAYASNPPPFYPRDARKRGWEGVVRLRVFVQADGRPGTVAVAGSSGYEMLDQSAVMAVRGWRFVPARLGNQPRDSWAELNVLFQLNGL